eukprot:6179637-Pleurochrysis_carterae.AAC.2
MDQARLLKECSVTITEEFPMANGHITHSCRSSRATRSRSNQHLNSQLTSAFLQKGVGHAQMLITWMLGGAMSGSRPPACLNAASHGRAGRPWSAAGTW